MDQNNPKDKKTIKTGLMMLGLGIIFLAGTIIEGVMQQQMTIFFAFLFLSMSLLFIGFGIYFLTEKYWLRRAKEKERRHRDLIKAINKIYEKRTRAISVVLIIIAVGGILYARQLILEIRQYSSGVGINYLYLAFDALIVSFVVYGAFKNMKDMKNAGNFQMLTRLIQRYPEKQQFIMDDLTRLYFDEYGMNHVYVSRDHLLAITNQLVIVLPAEDLLWVFIGVKQVRSANQNIEKVTLCIGCADGNIHRIDHSDRAGAQETMDYIGHRMPWLLYGDSKFFQEEYKYNIDNMIRQVRTRRQNMGGSL